MMSIVPEPNRIEELLAEEAVFGLEPAHRAELDQLLAANPEAETIEFEQAAAAYYMAAAPLEIESMPDTLRTKVLTSCLNDVTQAIRPDAAQEAPTPAPSTDANLNQRNLAGWILTAAAGLMIGFFLGGTEPSAPMISMADQRATLLEADPDVTTISWTATDAPEAKGASGDVVWSNAKQEGYMTFRGLKANDPTKEQYQLWVFDAERDERYPVDGGVFNIPDGAGEVVTPITTKINVTKATLFAITIEKPGGVVVSDRSRLPLLAKVE